MKAYSEYIPFKNLSADEVEMFTSKFRIVEFKKGEIILNQGQIQRDIYFVINGIQMSYFETDKKQQVIAFTYFPGICAIPGSFSFQAPSDTFLTALTDSKLLALSYTELEEILSKSHTIESTFRKMTEAILAGVIKRHIELHSNTIEERFTSFCKRSPHLLKEVAHKHIASYLGIDASNFSKLYNSIKI